jgi:CHASE2 domain-containing sensor protein
VNFPPRVILALVAIAVFAVIAVWGIVAVLRAERLTAGRRMAGIGGIILIVALLIAWVAFIWPAYWD